MRKSNTSSPAGRHGGRRRAAFAAAAVACVFAGAWQLSVRLAAAAAGDLDPSFQAQTVFGARTYAGAMARQPDGKIIVVGDVGDPDSNTDFGVKRYNADGTPDQTFGDGGLARTDVRRDHANAVVLQPDGKIVVAGSSLDGFFGNSSDYLLVRYNPDGSFDPTFGGGRLVLTDFLGSFDSAAAVAIQPDGKIVALGQSSDLTTSSFFTLARYNPDGLLDPSFGTGGRVVTDFEFSGPRPEAVAVQPDGKIVAFGTAGRTANGEFDFVTVRYHPDGSPDLTFGADGTGKVFTDFGPDSETETATDMALQPDGKILLAGEFNTPSVAGRFALARLNPDGSLDARFNSGGAVVTAFPEGRSTAHAILLQPDAKIVLVGGLDLNSARPDFGSGVLLARYRPDGTLDPSFGAGGRAATLGNNTLRNAYDAVLQPDGRIVVAGSGIARYLNDDNFPTPTATPTPSPAPSPSPTPIRGGTLDPSFGAGAGRQLLDVGGAAESCATSVALQADGKIVVAGEVGDPLVIQEGVISRRPTERMNFAVLRLRADGTPDTSFGAGGTGLVTADISRGDVANAVAVQPDGRIVLAGQTNVSDATQSDFALARYLADGTPDPTFGTGGVVRTDFFSSADAAYGLVVQPDGKLLVSGAAGGSVALARYHADGTPDTSFGTGGKVSDATGIAYAVALQADGRIVVSAAGGCDFVALRYRPDGTRDPSFGTGGRVSTDLGFNFCDEARSVAVQPDGKIVLAGDLTAKQFALVRYHADGSRDNGFDSDGIVTTVFPSREAIATDVVVHPDGGLFAVGGGGPGFAPPNQPPPLWALARYHADGAPNTFFTDSAGFGRVTTVMSNSTSRQPGGTALGAVLQPDGKLVVAGSAYNSKAVFGVARYFTTLTDAAPAVKFLAASASFSEADRVAQLTVVRTGDATAPASVDYRSHDGTASQKTDYTAVVGTLHFAPGETAKTISVSFTRDGFVEGDEGFTVALSNPSGAALGTSAVVHVTIRDDSTGGGANPIDDASAFVRQHYLDFLGREPDAAGLQFWTAQITACERRPEPERQGCREERRIQVSAAFFLSTEYQTTGFFALRVGRAAFGHRSDAAAVRVAYLDLLRDQRRLAEGVVIGEAGAEQRLEANRVAYLAGVVAGADFVARFPASQTAAEYVDALYASAGVAPTPAERQAAIDAFGAGGATGRAAALRKVAESSSVFAAEFRAAFVLLQYHGYLRRNPTDPPDADDSGYQFWLGKLNEHGGDFVRAEMVKSFLVSEEYRERFGRP